MSTARTIDLRAYSKVAGKALLTLIHTVRQNEHYINLLEKIDAIQLKLAAAGACRGALAGKPSLDLAEVALRVGVHGLGKAPIERFTKELALMPKAMVTPHVH